MLGVTIRCVQVDDIHATTSPSWWNGAALAQAIPTWPAGGVDTRGGRESESESERESEKERVSEVDRQAFVNETIVKRNIRMQSVEALVMTEGNQPRISYVLGHVGMVSHVSTMQQYAIAHVKNNDSSTCMSRLQKRHKS